MTRSRVLVGAVAATLVCYVLIAALVATVDIPLEAPTASAPWIRPYRVIAALGFTLATAVHLPHVAGQFLAAILLGGVLGGVFATARNWLQ
jgi:hypothetical protein